MEVVRKLRKRAQDAQRRVVAGEVRAVGQMRGRIAGLRGELRNQLHQVRDVQMGRLVDVASLRSHHLRRGLLWKEVYAAQEELDRRQAKLDEERNALAAATKQLRVIEKLYEKRKTKYEVWVRRREQAAWDEAALHVHGRRQGMNPSDVGEV